MNGTDQKSERRDTCEKSLVLVKVLVKVCGTVFVSSIECFLIVVMLPVLTLV